MEGHQDHSQFDHGDPGYYMWAGTILAMLVLGKLRVQYSKGSSSVIECLSFEFRFGHC
jgi:hypothetical protein